jgi:hydrogenase-4 membrane subunit HyfE
MNKDLQAFIYGSSIVTTILAIVSFLRGRRDTAIFLALWAPTVLAWGAFFNTERPPYPNATDPPADRSSK